MCNKNAAICVAAKLRSVYNTPVRCVTSFKNVAQFKVVRHLHLAILVAIGVTAKLQEKLHGVNMP